MGLLSKQNQVVVKALLDLDITELQVFGFNKPELAFTLKIISNNLCVTIDEIWANRIKKVNLIDVYNAQNSERTELSLMQRIHKRIQNGDINFDVSVNTFYTSIIGVVAEPVRLHSYNIWNHTYISLQNLPSILKEHFNNNEQIIRLDKIRDLLLESKGNDTNTILSEFLSPFIQDKTTSIHLFSQRRLDKYLPLFIYVGQSAIIEETKFHKVSKNYQVGELVVGLIPLYKKEDYSYYVFTGIYEVTSDTIKNGKHETENHLTSKGEEYIGRLVVRTNSKNLLAYRGNIQKEPGNTLTVFEIRKEPVNEKDIPTGHVQIIAMSKRDDTFKGKTFSEVQRWLIDNISTRGYFTSQKPSGNTLLFQFDNHIIAIARRNKIKVKEKSSPWPKAQEDFPKCFTCIPNSVIPVGPITSSEFKQFAPNFKGFNQAWKKWTDETETQLIVQEVLKRRLNSPTTTVSTVTKSPSFPTYKLQTQTYLPPLILQGPPGTGKTYGVEQYIKHMLQQVEGTKDINIEDFRFTNLPTEIDTDNPPPIIWEIIQAHPSFSYEDFVRGMTTKSGDGLHFVAKDRILVQMARLATDLFKKHEEKSPKVILLIDEINRCNLSTVLGECILLLEPSKRMRIKGGKLHRGTPVRLQYEKDNSDENTLVLPQNLEIIGTMNTADRSIALMDYAIRRRFRFISCIPDKSTLPLILSQIGEDKQMNAVLKEVYKQHPKREKHASDILKSINKHLSETHRLGHSFFIVDEPGLTDEEWEKEFKDKINYEIIPLLREYKEDFSAWSDFSEDKYKGLIKELQKEIEVTNTTQNSDTRSSETTNNQEESTENSDE